MLNVVRLCLATGWLICVFKGFTSSADVVQFGVWMLGAGVCFLGAIIPWSSGRSA